MKRLMKVIFIISILFETINAKSVNPKDILETVQLFYSRFKGGDELLKKAEAYLVFPNVYKAGLIVGGSYGEGALVKNDSIVNYYRVYSTSVGFQAGAQKSSLIIIFFTKEALHRFVNKEEWRVGVDGSITVMNWAANTDVSSIDIRKDTIAVPFSKTGAMINLSLEGTVFQQLK